MPPQLSTLDTPEWDSASSPTGFKILVRLRYVVERLPFIDANRAGHHSGLILTLLLQESVGNTSGLRLALSHGECLRISGGALPDPLGPETLQRSKLSSERHWNYPLGPEPPGLRNEFVGELFGFR